MDEAELDEVYRALAGLLSDIGLEWIQAQANEEISLGRLVARVPTEGTRSARRSSLAADTFKTVEMVQGHPLAKGAAIATEPYDARQRVQALIRAIRRAIADSTAMERHVSAFLTQESARGVRPGPVRLLSAEESSADRTSLADIDYRVPETRGRVLQLLDQLNSRVAE